MPEWKCKVQFTHLLGPVPSCPLPFMAVPGLTWDFAHDFKSHGLRHYLVLLCQPMPLYGHSFFSRTWGLGNFTASIWTVPRSDLRQIETGNAGANSWWMHNIYNAKELCTFWRADIVFALTFTSTPTPPKKNDNEICVMDCIEWIFLIVLKNANVLLCSFLKFRAWYIYKKLEK